MKYIQSLFLKAEEYKRTRCKLAENLKKVDENYSEETASLERDRVKTVSGIESRRDSNVKTVEMQTAKWVSDYEMTKGRLRRYSAQIAAWCPKGSVDSYSPNPANVTEHELDRLVKMVQEQGFVAWVKRTFKLHGYASRSEMAHELFCKVEDACAYCDDRIDEVRRDCDQRRSKFVTDARREIAQTNEKYVGLKADAERNRDKSREKEMAAISRFDASAELKNLHDELEQSRNKAEEMIGKWGSYKPATEMPERVMLCETSVVLPGKNGVDEAVTCPVWLDMFESNVVVITSEKSMSSNCDKDDKMFARKFLARLLKTVPSANVSYSVFDELHNGYSLGGLINATSMGTTDFKFDLFTSKETTDKKVSCDARRKYLLEHLTDVVKKLGGQYKSLYEYNRTLNNYDYSFTWYVDFGFPEKISEKLASDLNELFINAPVAGYSFVFVTNQKGYDIIKEMLNGQTGIKLTHVDADSAFCQSGNVKLNYTYSTAPSDEQIGNFMKALNEYYSKGADIDNRIESVFKEKGIERLDASFELKIPMALDSRGNLYDFKLGGLGSVHGFVSGGTNSGKSTLLHSIILSACLHYTPKDLEIWLVDYKQTEFFLYKKKTPPHIKLIGVSKTADFTFGLIDKIIAEGERRTKLMNLFEVQNLQDYRKHEGELGYENLTRLFIIIDEFHEMSQFVADEPSYKDKLENILREYRAQGINCLFADQTFGTGLSGLSVAAKNQMALRIAMKNEVAPQEIKDTLEVDRAMYSQSMEQTIKLMQTGDFITKVFEYDETEKETNVKLEKFKALFAKKDDIVPVGEALQAMYAGQYTNDLLYVNTKEQVAWNDEDMGSLDLLEPLRRPNIRLYLGRAATLRPCFGLDIGRQPNDNLSVVGGTAHNRWELIASVIKSCCHNNYKLLVFMAEYSDLMNDYADEIRDMCSASPNIKLIEEYSDWCSNLKELETVIDQRKKDEDCVCLFIGLEIAALEMERFPAMPSVGRSSMGDRFAAFAKPGSIKVDETKTEAAELEEFNALPIIGKLFESGSRNGIRCVTEVSVYRQFHSILKIRDMCRHKVAFDMSADDCAQYMGSGSFQKSIGHDAIYGDGGKSVKKLITYKFGS